MASLRVRVKDTQWVLLTAVVGLELPRQPKSFLDYFDPSELARPCVEWFPPWWVVGRGGRCRPILNGAHWSLSCGRNRNGRLHCLTQFGPLPVLDVWWCYLFAPWLCCRIHFKSMKTLSIHIGLLIEECPNHWRILFPCLLYRLHHHCPCLRLIQRKIFPNHCSLIFQGRGTKYIWEGAHDISKGVGGEVVSPWIKLWFEIILFQKNTTNPNDKNNSRGWGGLGGWARWAGARKLSVGISPRLAPTPLICLPMDSALVRSNSGMLLTIRFTWDAKLLHGSW